MADLSVPDSIKMLRETFCVAQSAIGSTCITPYRPIRERAQEHIARLQRLIDDCDRQRPLGPDGKHGDMHTPTCGCDDAPEDDPHANQTCGFLWAADNDRTSSDHQCAESKHDLAGCHRCGCGETRPGVVVLGAAIGREGP